MSEASIILADDDILLRKFMRMVIQKNADHTIIEAGDGIELLRKSEETTPDAVVLDISLPNLRSLQKG